MIVEFTNVRAGPSSAYIVKGRVYRDDKFSVRGERGKKWVEIVTGKVRGFIPMTSIVIIRLDGAPVVDGKLDVGRDKRLRNYRYNNDGRRLTDDAFTGSGEGTRKAPVPEVPIFGEGTFGAILGLGIGGLERVFQSNISPDSILTNVRLQPSGLVVFGTIDWRWQHWLKLRLSGSDLRKASSKVRLDPEMETAFDMAADAQEGTFDVALSYGHSFWQLSGIIGTGMQRVNFRPTVPTVLALSTHSVGLHGGLELIFRWKRFEALACAVYGGVLTVSQQPQSSGDGTGDYTRLLTAVTYWLHPSWGIRLSGLRVARLLNFKGDADHTDTLSGAAEPYTYTRAQESDQILWLGLGTVARFQ